MHPSAAPPEHPLRAARRAAGLSQRGLALHLGYANHADVCMIELGSRKPWPEFRRRAAELLGIPEEQLFPEAER